uniref:Sugar transporter SWEET1 n=1 Tax=Oryctolagus cuniculus TaxID=9986 RepID=A0A5F9C423_RABIT
MDKERDPTCGGGGVEEGGMVTCSFPELVCTLGMFSIGLSDLRHVQMTRSVDSIQFLPFLTTDVNNLGWLSYGTMKGDGLLMSVNAVGAVLQTLCILVSPLYCPQKPAVIQTKSTKRLSFSRLPPWSLYGQGLVSFLHEEGERHLTSFIRFWFFWKYPQEQDRNYQLLQA